MNIYGEFTATQDQSILPNKQKVVSSHQSMLNSLQQMYFGNRNTNSTRETYSQALVAPHGARDSSQNAGGSRPLQQTYSRYMDQENFNHANLPKQNQPNRVRFDP